VFAVSIGVGLRGVSPRERLRLAIAFPSAEVLMNCVGALLAAGLGRLIGDAAGYLGFGALVLVGLYMIYEVHDAEGSNPIDVTGGWGLVLASLGISLDSLGVGFSILFVGVPLGLSLMVIAVVSVVATLLGLSLGRALGARVERISGLLAGVLLASTGVAFIVLKALHLG